MSAPATIGAIGTMSVRATISDTGTIDATGTIIDRVRVTYHGDATIAAGSLATFGVDVEARAAIPPGAEIGIARRWPSDWGTPQFNDPAAPDYVAITAAPGRN